MLLGGRRMPPPAPLPGEYMWGEGGLKGPVPVPTFTHTGVPFPDRLQSVSLPAWWETL